MKIAIYSRGLDPGQEHQLSTLVQLLQQRGASVTLFETLVTAQYAETLDGLSYEVFSNNFGLDETVDCVVTLGGDGTVLDAALMIGDKNIPLLGINFGRLGFLATIVRNDMEQAVEALLNERFSIDQRTLIHMDADEPLFHPTPFALNEFVLHKRDFSSMIKIHTYLNGEFLNTYWADGLVVSTPTGSTGYNLSCNGPIIFPESKSLVITPIAPHNLNVRSIVVPDDHIISFEIEGRSDNYVCSLDARKAVANMQLQVAVRKEDFTIGMIRLSENTFLETLRNKLTWGLDKRN